MGTVSQPRAGARAIDPRRSGEFYGVGSPTGSRESHFATNS